MARQKVIGEAKCPLCDHPVTVKEMASGQLYYTCPPPADGGCGTQHFCRYDRSSEQLAKRITAWRDPADKKRWLGREPAPSPAPAPEPKRKPRSPAPPAPKPAREPEPEPETDEWDFDKEMGFK